MSAETASKNYPKRGGFNPVKNPGPPNRKIQAKLDARVKDYAAMTARMDFKAPAGAFHRPGSRQK